MNMKMKEIWKRGILLLVCCVLVQLTCHADVFKGKIVNAETSEPLAGVNVRAVIHPRPEWTYTNSAETDSLGNFQVSAPAEGRTVFTFSMIGFKTLRKVDYAYGPDVCDTTDMGTIKLSPTALMLKEVEVKANLPRFTMRGDTIVFNPEAFKLKEGARLEELIKKLPGVYQEDGKLYWNGKPIRLTMNGKNVFGGDDILGKLPADAAKKIKLYDHKSELARHTGKDDGNEDHVLDIQVKPGFLDKWYGEIEGNYVTKDRYSGSLEANKLSDHDPQMVYAEANNTNRYYARTMSMSYDTNIDGDGKSQYGSYNYQHNWKTKGTDDYDDNSVSVGANFGHSDGFGREETTTETYFPNTDRTFSLKRDDAHSHKLSPQLNLRLFAYTDSVNTISLSVDGVYEKKRNTYENDAASYVYAPGLFAYYSLDEALAAKPGEALYDRLITRNRNYTTEDSEEKRLYVQYEWEHFFGKKGSFKLNGFTYLQGIDSNQLTDRKLEYLHAGNIETLWQMYNKPQRHFQDMLNASMNYWLGKKVYATLSDKVTYIRYHEYRDFYADTEEKLVEKGNPTTLDPSNSMSNMTHKWNNLLTLSSTITPVKQLMIMPKLEWNMWHEKMDYQYGDIDTTAVRRTHFFDPSILMRWKMSRERSMDLSFAYKASAPSLVKTVGYRDTTDPLLITMGNSCLANSYYHVTSYHYRRMWLRQQINLALSASYRKDIQPLATLYRYNSSTGVYELMPMNVKGGEQWKFGVNYDQGLGVCFRIANQLDITTARSYGYMTILDKSNKPLSALLANEGILQLNRQRYFNLTDRLEFSYESEKLKWNFYNRVQWNRYCYTDASYNSTPLYDQLGMKGSWELKPFTINVDIKDDFRSGYQTSDMNGHRVLGSLLLEYRFCKNKCTLSLEADDIFNKDVYYTTQTTAYQRTESSKEYFHHYLLIGFNYKFDAKVKNKH